MVKTRNALLILVCLFVTHQLDYNWILFREFSLLSVTVTRMTFDIRCEFSFTTMIKIHLICSVQQFDKDLDI